MITVENALYITLVDKDLTAEFDLTGTNWGNPRTQIRLNRREIEHYQLLRIALIVEIAISHQEEILGMEQPELAMKWIADCVDRYGFDAIERANDSIFNMEDKDE